MTSQADRLMWLNGVCSDNISLHCGIWNTYYGSFNGNNNISLLIGDLQVVGFSDLPGVASVSAQHTPGGNNGGQQAGDGE